LLAQNYVVFDQESTKCSGVDIHFLIWL